MSDQERLNETVAKRAINAMVEFAWSIRQANMPVDFGKHTQDGVTVNLDPYEWVNTPQGQNELNSYRGRLMHGFDDEMSQDEKLQTIAGSGGLAGQMATLVNGIVPDLRAQGERIGLARLAAEVCDEVKTWTLAGYDLIYPPQPKPGSPIVFAEALDHWERSAYPIHEKLWTVAREAARAEKVSPEQPMASSAMFPADHYRQIYGLQPNTLNKARRDGRLKGEKRIGRWFYAITAVRQLWPDVFVADDEA